MADDVRISVGLPHHPKTKKLRRRVGVEGCWSLIVLFLWVGSERWDGDLAGMSDEDIELAAEWEGEPDAFVAAMIEVGFLRGEPGRRVVHRWQDHNPYAAAKGERIEKGRRAAEARWGKRAARGTESNAPSMGDGCSGHAAGIGEQCPPAPAPAPAPAPSVHTDASTHTPRDARGHTDGSFEGAFEGHDDPPFVAPNPVAPLAIALTRAGFGCTPMNPDLIAYHGAGGSVDHLLAIAADDACSGKPAAYVIAWARRELTGSPRPVQAGAPARGAPPSKSTMALQALEGLKHGGVANRHDRDGAPEAPRALAGPDARS